jgi:hypothetical protein
MAKRPTAPEEAKTETPATRRHAATAAATKTAKARKAIAAPKSPSPPRPPRAKVPARKPADNDAGPAPRRRPRAATRPTAQPFAEPHRAPADERDAGEMAAKPYEGSAYDEAVEQPFAEGAGDSLDPDLRHRMISETAYRLYMERGYEDGYDLDDWLQAEAEVDHLLVDRRPS